MQITNRAGYWEILFTFELDNPEALNEFIQRIEAKIPSNALRLYADDCAGQSDEEIKQTNMWTVPDFWIDEFMALYKEIFKDRNQISMDF